MREHLGFHSPRRAALLYPFETALVFWLLVVSVLFTFWPEGLEHAPISFEERGVIHHAWHYSIVAGSIATAAGLVSTSVRASLAEVVGLVLLASAVGMNIIAIIADAITDGEPGSLEGWAVTLRLSILTGLILRAYVITAEPVVEVTVKASSGDE